MKVEPKAVNDNREEEKRAFRQPFWLQDSGERDQKGDLWAVQVIVRRVLVHLQVWGGIREVTETRGMPARESIFPRLGAFHHRQAMISHEWLSQM